MFKRMTRNKYIAVTSSLLTLVLFQNCVRFNGLSSSYVPELLNQKSNANGGSYDGKLEAYLRLVPGHTCDGKPVEYGKMQLNGDSSILMINDDLNCQSTKTINTADIEVSAFTNKYLGYLDGLYTYSQNVQNSLVDPVFTEAWCKSNFSPQTEFAIEWTPSADSTSISIYTSKDKSPQVFSARRELNATLVTYSNGLNTIDIQFAAKIPGAATVKGNFSGLINGLLINGSMNCRMGGQFDSSAPKLDYAKVFQTLEIGESVNDLSAIVNKPAKNFDIKPALPMGLIFDPSDGSIHGAPTQVSVRKNYVVTAYFSLGQINRAFSIGVSRTVAVNTMTSNLALSLQCMSANVDCTLSAAVQFANSIRPTPVTLRLGENIYEISSGELPIAGDIELSGAGERKTILDARKLSRHFQVQEAATLSLKNLSLINGVEKRGGSISINSARLNLNNVVMKNNSTIDSTVNAGGGAIYSNDSEITIYKSQFNFNIAANNNYGGAIYAGGHGKFIAKDSIFDGNSATLGGAIFLDTDGEMSGLKFSNNKGEGAGIYIRSGDSVSIIDSEFKNNFAFYHGGAVYIFRPDKVWIEKNEMSYNQAQSGSAVYLFAPSGWSMIPRLYLIDSTLHDNGMAFHEYFPDVRGSALHLHSGQIFMRGNNLEKNLNQDNCMTTFAPNAFSGFLSLGENRSDDLTCPH